MRANARRAAIALVVGAAASGSPAQAQSDTARLRQSVEAPHRSEANRQRDIYRNPMPVLTFLNLSPGARVIEILPGSSLYWTEILAPYLKEAGHYTAAIPKANPDRPELLKAIAETKAKLLSTPGAYDRVVTIDFTADAPVLGSAGSADFVLTLRNLHNWMAAGKAEQVLAGFYAVLRQGGVLGIEEHRGRTDQPQDPAAKSGYVREDYAIALIEKTGLRLVAKSEVNANPRDTKDYTAGVWTLPPTYRLKDQDRDKYSAIGESDRFVMTFVKP